MKRIAGALLLAVAVSSCRTAPKIPYKGRTFYTRVNIWYNPLRKEEILSTNYHSGEILPVGTAVRVTSVSGSTIRFKTLESNEEFRLHYIKVYVGVPIEKYFERMFSDRKPTMVGRFNEKERKAITLGEVESGMTRDAVIMSWGYPPAHHTSSLKNNHWKYWMGRTSTMTVKFYNDEVVSVK